MSMGKRTECTRKLQLSNNFQNIDYTNRSNNFQDIDYTYRSNNFQDIYYTNRSNNFQDIDYSSRDLSCLPAVFAGEYAIVYFYEGHDSSHEILQIVT
jgi:hypothetical protein